MTSVVLGKVLTERNEQFFYFFEKVLANQARRCGCIRVVRLRRDRFFREHLDQTRDFAACPLPYSKIRSPLSARTGSIGLRLASPIRIEALKIAPTGTKPPNLCAATAASAIDAMQPQAAQSGLPPNWQGVTCDRKSAEIMPVVRAKTQSSGLCGGFANCSIMAFGMSSFGYSWRSFNISAIARARSSALNISGNWSPICGVKILNQIRLISGLGVQNSRNSFK